MAKRTAGIPTGRLLQAELRRGNPSSADFGHISDKMGHAVDIEILRPLRLGAPVVVDRAG